MSRDKCRRRFCGPARCGSKEAPGGVAARRHAAPGHRRALWRRRAAALRFAVLTMPTRTTADLRRLDKQYLWHPFTHMQQWLADDHAPLVITAAEGMFLID